MDNYSYLFHEKLIFLVFFNKANYFVQIGYVTCAPQKKNARWVKLTLFKISADLPFTAVVNFRCQQYPIY